MAASSKATKKTPAKKTPVKRTATKTTTKTTATSKTAAAPTPAPAKKPLVLYQAITQSYKLRQILHAMQPKAVKTLCGRAIEKGSHMEFDATTERVCAKCVQSIELMNRAHPGWE